MTDPDRREPNESAFGAADQDDDLEATRVARPSEPIPADADDPAAAGPEEVAPAAASGEVGGGSPAAAPGEVAGGAPVAPGEVAGGGWQHDGADDATPPEGVPVVPGAAPGAGDDRSGVPEQTQRIEEPGQAEQGVYGGQAGEQAAYPGHAGEPGAYGGQPEQGAYGGQPGEQAAYSGHAGEPGAYGGQPEHGGYSGQPEHGGYGAAAGQAAYGAPTEQAGYGAPTEQATYGATAGPGSPEQGPYGGAAGSAPYGAADQWQQPGGPQGTAVMPPAAGYPPAGQPAYDPSQPQGTGAYAPAPGQPGAPASSTEVVLPPVRMPAAESRVAINALGTVVGLILVAGGLVLLLIFANRMMVDFQSFEMNWLNIALTIVGALLIAAAAFLGAWTSWASIVPGFILAGLCVWSMVTYTDENGGARLISDALDWAFKENQLYGFLLNGTGLTVGLLLFASGIAAVLLRAGVRRTIRRQLESIQS